jgi:hypothetical protein
MKTTNKHFKALHKTECTNIHDSDCYQVPVQAIDRKRNRKVLIMKTNPEATSIKRSRKKLSHAFTIANVKFKGRCVFVDRHGVLRCHCDNIDKGKMDTDGLNSHMTAFVHNTASGTD